METLSTSELLERINKLVELLERALVKRDFYPPRLTKYEIARIIGARALQLAMGAQPKIDIRELGTTDPVLIALEEFRRGLLDFIIVREFPDGKAIKIRLRELLELEKTL
ncbi:DNA-directed RNA polymerase, subunit K [Pyrobaculum islandicum DSM 4184]|uniref:DNA-directed RNA polymerase subunit Rpo6 n=1 Tax=Pyrobaculum islandicum (strain DSM 4184 / JCM 9189 / GEO3) TaxID=384616 RepID=A1RRU8_PYRIL|nr:DNA-directed RNA polymerase subunit K [Pyrobaculum islandicum]ABL87680.1 DNA-directed RNA polymerase, subunit K [Pyrobaculum islandicum DSM 4184]